VTSKSRQQWHPPSYDKKAIRAVQAVQKYSMGGDTPPSQTDCQVFLDWLINEACATYGEPFRPGSNDEVSYMLGRRSVGLAIVKLIHLKPELFE
jgi:hypothetical protein